MFQRDYILRMIEQLSQVMARFLMLKSLEERQEVLIQLEEFYGKLMLPPVKLLLRMPDNELLALVSVNGEPDLDKAAALGYLLKEEGRVHEALEQYESSSERFNKALFLFIWADRLGADVSGMDCGKQIEDLRELLRTYVIPGPTLQLLVDHYESRGLYAQAEDVLFELLESDSSRVEGNLTAGEQFFDRIMLVPDESLELGGLPRHEVVQGVEDLRRQFGTSADEDARTLY